VAGRRILEVGCGIGLASLMLNQRLADITATDHHPSAGAFLRHNVDLNHGRAIPFLRTGWDDAVSDMGEFDLIIGSDLLYEPDHAGQLAGFIDQHANPSCEVIIIDPNRGNSGKFSTRMADLGYAHSRTVAETPDSQTQPYRGKILRYTRAMPAH
jgi:predicted nicotinamide N-methyase